MYGMKHQIRGVFALFAAVAVLAIGCDSIPEPPEPGVYLLGEDDQMTALRRVPIKEVKARRISTDRVKKFPTIGDEPTFIVRAPGLVAEKIELWSRQRRTMTGRITIEVEQSEDNPDVFQIKLPEPGPGGLYALRVKGKGVGGLYPYTTGNNPEWFAELGANLRNERKHKEALEQFRLALAASEGSPVYRLDVTNLLLELNDNQVAATEAETAWLDTLELIKDEAPEAKDVDLMDFGVALMEARFRIGSFADAINVYEDLDTRFPTKKGHKKQLASVLERVEPSPATITIEVHKAVAESGAEGLEPFMLPEDIEKFGKAGLQKVAREMLKFGRINEIVPTRTKIFGRTARVKYKVLYAKGNTVLRDMNFRLDDKATWRFTPVD